MAAPSTNDDFLEVVRKSNQVDTGRLNACLEQYREGDTLPPDPKKLAALLVREGLLTNFQAEQFLLGRWRGFALGGYRILERVGAGGTGTVFLGEHEVMKRRVAIKILPTSFASQPGVLERFRREAQAAGALDHPNIVRAYDFRQEGQTHFLVMEYVNGPSLQQVLESEGPMSVPVACEYIRQAAIGLQHAHETGMVHRDVKPGNLLVDPSGILKILDMGLARFAPEGQDSLTKQFDENTVMGTADYLAPEQALSLHNVDARADIYSLGATLYALLAGEAPFASGTITQKLLWHQMRDPTPLDQRREDIPPEIAEVVARMMAKDTHQRYQTCTEVAEALDPFCATTPTPQGPARPGQSNGAGSAPYVKGNSTSTGSSVRLSHNSSRRKMSAPTPPEREAVVEKPTRQREDRDEDDRDRSRRRRDVDVRRPPADTGSMVGILMLVIAIGAILMIVGGVIAFLVLAPAPSGGSSEDNTKKPVEKQKSAGLPVTRPQDTDIVLGGNPLPMERIAFSPDGGTLICGGKDRLIHIWDVQAQTNTAGFRGHEGDVYFVRLGPSRSRLLSSSADGTARLWEYPSGKPLQRLPVEKGKVWCVIFGRNENEVITAGDDGIIRVWDAANVKVVKELKGHTAAIQGLAHNPNQKFAHQVITASHDSTLKVWDLNTGKDVVTLKGHTGPCSAVAIHPNGETAVSASHDGTVRQWQLSTGQMLHPFTPNQGPIWAVAVSMDGKRLASAGADPKITLWDLERRTQERVLQGHTAGVPSLAFAPDSKSLASCSLDKTLRVWPLGPPK